ncbi:hypothetical protein [Sphingomonas sp. CCH15-F11]|uniref:hypothetical protein n=1 Tax=Sphingomonas sp. CCH15-F11 TaxID=1768785 RepID=UPI00082D5F3D|nr:hypothetical protein [Sphingomonas sp. CCH15-F11]
MSAAVDPASLPRLADLPIPADVRPGKGWTGQMVELAAHIGAFDTLRIVAAYGGQSVYIPIDPERNPFRELIGPAKAKIVSQVYGPYQFFVPVARHAVDRAKRGGVLALVRSGQLSKRQAAVILGTSRNYVDYLVRQPDEDGPPLPALRRQPVIDPRQISIFDVLPPTDGG